MCIYNNYVVYDIYNYILYNWINIIVIIIIIIFWSVFGKSAQLTILPFYYGFVSSVI